MAPKSERQFVKKITLACASGACMRYAYLNISCVKARIYLCGLVKYTTDTLGTIYLLFLIQITFWIQSIVGVQNFSFGRVTLRSG